MLQITLSSATSSAGKAEMYIDYQSGGVGFTVIHNEFQHDFNIEEEDWGLLIKFIELQKESEKIQRTLIK